MSVNLHAKSLEMADAVIQTAFETFVNHGVQLVGENAWKAAMDRVDVELGAVINAEDGELWTSCFSALILCWAAQLVKTVNEKEASK